LGVKAHTSTDKNKDAVMIEINFILSQAYKLAFKNSFFPNTGDNILPLFLTEDC
jgi:hypothetical protein